MLEVCPSKRPSAEELLGHEFFKDCPPMVELPFDDFTDEARPSQRVNKTQEIDLTAVSYTHLTLPTNREV